MNLLALYLVGFGVRVRFVRRVSGHGTDDTPSEHIGCGLDGLRDGGKAENVYVDRSGARILASVYANTNVSSWICSHNVNVSSIERVK